MAELDPIYIIRALLWLVGIPIGLFVRFGLWAAKQQRKVTLRQWWEARIGANAISISLGLIATLFWAEGSFYKAAHLDKLGVELTYGLAPIVSGIVTVFAHYFLAAGKRRAEAAAGGPPEGD